MAYKRADLLKDIAESAIYGNLGLFISTGMSKAVFNGGFKDIDLFWKHLLLRNKNTTF